MTAAPGSHGAEAPQGPGWWLASDGRYYPPELAPDVTTSKAPDTAAPKKKKVVKKVAAKKPAAKSSNDAKPAAKKPAAKSASAATAASADDALPAAKKRPGQQKFTAHAPATDQIAARRIQAKEQSVLLASARQQAALRALSGIARAEEPMLVGVGGRSLEARPEFRDSPGAPPHPVQATPAADELVTAPACPEQPSTPVEPPTEPPPTASAPTIIEPTTTEPTIIETTGAGSTALPTNGNPPTSSPVTESATTTGTPESPPMAETAPAPATTVPVVPHQPASRPQPSAPMGTDVPFMELKGSALATDVDRIGERILIFADRVELRDRSNVARQTIRYDQLAHVEVQRKLMGPSLVITSVAGASMAAKALRPELASGAKAMIEKHADRYRRGEGPASTSPAASTSPPETATRTAEPAPGAQADDARGRPTHKAVLLGMLEELHAAGVLSAEELETKKALIEFTSRP